MLRSEIETYIKAHEQEAYELLLTLGRIPAPSNHEEKRAQFCLEWLHRQGAGEAYLDEALNVVYPVDDDGEGPLEVYMAHTDVVFPDTDPLPLRAADGRIWCPGIGDDTACLVCVLMAAKFIAEYRETPLWRELRGGLPGLLLVGNSGEEGLGNLKGVRRICQTYGSRMVSLCTFDSCLDKLVNRAVGSRRFQIEVSAQGGHSYNDFGRDSAICELAGIICRLYQIQVPSEGKTTYNVGVISGGTSINTIAQKAELLYEFRSERREHLTYMQEQLDAVLEEARGRGVSVRCQVIGERPCEGSVDPAARERLLERGMRVVEGVTGQRPELESGSTDCNIPLAMGIPAICVGSFRGDGAHTREEYLEIASLAEGYRVAFAMILGERSCSPS